MRLTSKMATERLANSDNCKCFFPMNEGSGTTFTDLVTSAVFTDASADHTTGPHAPALLSTSLTGVSDGWLTLPANKVIVFAMGIRVLTAGAFSTVRLGTASQSRLQMAADYHSHEYDGGTEVNFTALSSALTGQDSFSAVFLDGTSGNGYLHECIHTAAATLHSTVATVPTDKAMTLSASGALNTTFRPGVYGIGVWVLDELPSEAERNAILQFIKDNWTVGKKVLPPQLS